jgi:hypothetical protein
MYWKLKAKTTITLQCTTTAPLYFSKSRLEMVLPILLLMAPQVIVQNRDTDKRTDVWSRDFIIWKINFGLWAMAWAGQWEKGSGPVMSNF